MKLYQAIDLYNTCNKVKNLQLPFKVAYKFAKMINQLEKEVDFYKENFQKIIDEYGVIENNQYKLSNDKTSILIQSGREEECNLKIEELKNMEIDFAVIEFNINDFDKIDVTAEDIKYLLPYIKD